MFVNDPEELGRLFAELVNAGDLDGLVSLYEDSATFVGPDGRSASGSDAIRERLQELLAMTPEITLTSSGAVMAGDVALMSNRWRMSLGRQDGASTGFDGASTEVARRQPDGGWLYAIDNPSLLATASAGNERSPV